MRQPDDLETQQVRQLLRQHVAAGPAWAVEQCPPRRMQTALWPGLTVHLLQADLGTRLSCACSAC